MIQFLLLIFMLSGCTFNVSMAHTSGRAVDTIDDALTNTPDIRPTLAVPIIPTTPL